MKNFIHFKNIDFSYTDGSKVFSGLNLGIAKGEKVGIVGHSGAGKSTLINLLLKNFAITNYKYWDRPVNQHPHPNPLPEVEGAIEINPPLPLGEDRGEGNKIFTAKVFIERSRELRKNQTDYEKIFWDAVRNNKLGCKFRRQHAIDNKYIADFVCLENKLIIEIDGGQHCGSKYDQGRDTHLMQEGYRILRFWNNEIYENLEGCIEAVKNALTPTLSPGRGSVIDQGGDILINNQSIYDVSSDSLRSQISLIPQDIMLFHRSIGENIGYAKDSATQNEIEHAAKAANIHKFIETLPEKYNTVVGERGVKLSGGQRQRIAIARAILKNAPILILDEATSSLDSQTEQEIQKSINTMLDKNNATVIAIAHRLSTIKHLDRIIVIKNGEIVEDGSFSDLLAKKDGQFKEMWEHQVNGMVI